MTQGFQNSAFQNDGFQVELEIVVYDGFQPCAFQYGVFQTSVCGGEPPVIERRRIGTFVVTSTPTQLIISETFIDN